MNSAVSPLKMPTAYAFLEDYMHTQYGMTLNEWIEFLEDNPDESKKQYVVYHYQYFFFLTHLHNLSYHMPLYYYKDNTTLTRYHPPLPPRAFTTYFDDLPSLWEQLLQEVSICFSIPPQADLTNYQTPRTFTNVFFNKIHQQFSLETSDVRDIHRYAHIACDEIWIVDLMPPHPIALPLSLLLNITRYQNMYPTSQDKYILEKYNHYLRSYLLIMEILKHTKHLPTHKY